MSKSLQEMTDQELRNELRLLEISISISYNIQQAKKIQMNSVYGASGNEFFRYFDIRLAEAVTMTGQFVIQWAEKYINNFLNSHHGTTDIDYILAIDTDSLYIALGKFMKQHAPAGAEMSDLIDLMDKFCNEELSTVIDGCYDKLFDYTNGFESRMVMKRETLCSRGIWTAKKHYALDVHDSEGVRYGSPKLKIMGFDMVKSSLPGVCRDKMKEAMKIILRGNESKLIKFIRGFKKEFTSLQPEEIAFPRTVNNLTKYSHPVTLYQKRCPIHVRASLVYNDAIRKHGLQKQYEIIKEGEKIRFIYLRAPNQVNENVIAFLHRLPPELNIRDSIDYDLQFEKTFEGPLKTILDVIGWETQKRIKIQDFLR